MKARWLGHSHLDGVTLTATTEAMSVDNLQDTDIQTPWRSATVLDQRIDAPFGASKAVSGMHLEGINITAQGHYVLQLSQDGFASVVYAETFQKWAEDMDHAAATLWLSGDSGGHRIADGNGDVMVDGNGDAMLDRRYNPGSPVQATDLRLLVSDPDNPDGYHEIGRPKVGEYFDEDLHGGPVYDEPEQGDLVRMRGGGYRAAQKPPPREIGVAHGQLDEDGTFVIGSPGVVTLISETGHRDDVVLSVFPGAGGDLERRFIVLGRIVSRSEIQIHNTSRTGSAIKLRSRLRVTVSEAL